MTRSERLEALKEEYGTGCWECSDERVALVTRLDRDETYLYVDHDLQGAIERAVDNFQTSYSEVPEKLVDLDTGEVMTPTFSIAWS